MRIVTAFDLGALAGRAVFEKTALGVTAPKAQMLNSTVGRALKAPAPAPAPNLNNPANLHHVNLQSNRNTGALGYAPTGLPDLANPVNMHHADLAAQRGAAPDLTTPANQYHASRQTGAFGSALAQNPAGAADQTANNYHMNLRQNPPAPQYAGAANAYHLQRQPGAFGPQQAEPLADQTANNYHANLAQRRSR
jgi:hypothetical protein